MSQIRKGSGGTVLLTIDGNKIRKDSGCTPLYTNSEHLNNIQLTAILYSLGEIPNSGSKSSSKSGCFIATATYDSPNAKEVMILRQWRDEYLLHSYFGRSFVKIYYVISPSIAKIIGKYNILRKISKNLLNRFIKKLDYK